MIRTIMQLHLSSVFPLAACLIFCECCEHVTWEKSSEFHMSEPLLKCRVKFFSERPNHYYVECDTIFNCKMIRVGYSERILPPLARFMDIVKCYSYNTNIANTKLLTTENGEYVLLSRHIQSLLWVYFVAQNLSSDYLCALSHLLYLHIEGENDNSTPPWNFRIFSQMYNPDDSRNCCTCSITKVIVKWVKIGAILNDTFRGVPNIEILAFQRTPIRYIEQNAFAAVPKLRELEFVGAFLTTASTNAFAPLVHLCNLQLFRNRLNDEVFRDLRGFTDLTILNLSANSISNLNDRETFLPFRNLKILDLSGNNIRHIEKVIFDELEQILEIRLRYNQLESLSNNMIENNAHLTFLDLSVNSLTSIPKLNSKNLRHLKMTENRISDFSMSDTEKLCECTNLQTLDLDSNRIISIHPSAFKCSAKLTRINLGDNEIKMIDSVFHESIVQYLNLELNRITRFSFKDFSVNLVELNLRNNRIEEYPNSEDVLRYPMELRKLNLRSNSLHNFTGVFLPSKLEELDLSHNNIMSFSFAKNNVSHQFIIPENLKNIDLTFNSLYTLCPLLQISSIKKYEFHFQIDYNPIICPCEIMMSENVHKNGYRTNFNKYRYRLTCDAAFGKVDVGASVTTAHRRRKLSFVCDYPLNSNCQCNRHGSYVSVCNLECAENCTCFINHNFSIYWMNCSDNSLLHIPYLSFPPKLDIILDFSKNLLRQLNGNSFPRIVLVSELYLQNNRLTHITTDAFDNVSNLEVLNLQFNSLENLPFSVFANLTKLTELNLAHNKLIYFHSMIPASWTVDQWTFPDTIMLSNNPWSCECDNVEAFHKWLQQFMHQVMDADELTCVSADDPAKGFPIVLHPVTHCYTKEKDRALTILASVISVMGFLAVLVLLIYVYRRELEVFLYSRTGVRFFKEKEVNGVDRVFDAFVAYSSEDLEFVALELVPGLESIQNPYKLCVHERDFLAGIPIVDSIQAAVDHSQRTLVVLSSNFVESHWCSFEFKMAHHRMISDPSHRLIIILLGDIPQGMDREMNIYLKTNTYLKWGDRLFWEKLYHAMPDQKKK